MIPLSLIVFILLLILGVINATCIYYNDLQRKLTGIEVDNDGHWILVIACGFICICILVGSRAFGSY